MGNGCGKSSASAPTTNLAPVSPAASNTGTQEDDLMNTLNGDMKEKILWVFTKYDRDCSGSLDVNEILELMVEIQSVVDDSLVNEVKFTYNDSKVVLKALDADGNGEIDADEFIAWLTKGLAMDGDQFEAYMRSGPTQHQLATFLLGVKLYCELEYKTVDVTPVAVAEEKTAEKEETKQARTEAEQPNAEEPTAEATGESTVAVADEVAEVAEVADVVDVVDVADVADVAEVTEGGDDASAEEPTAEMIKEFKVSGATDGEEKKEEEKESETPPPATDFTMEN